MLRGWHYRVVRLQPETRLITGRRAIDTLKLIGYTLAIAIGIALLEGWIKYLSRATRYGPKYPLTKDDYDWWIEWIVTATVTLVIFLIINSHEHKPVSTSQIVWAIIALFAGYSALPKLANIFCLDSQGRVESILWLAVLNILAGFILMATVAVGVKIYG
jgi:hypothetical protein